MRAEWRAFCAKLGLQIVAEIWSNYHGSADHVVVGESGILAGSVHHLERGQSVGERPMVKALAQHLVETARKEVAG